METTDVWPHSVNCMVTTTPLLLKKIQATLYNKEEQQAENFKASFRKDSPIIK